MVVQAVGASDELCPSHKVYARLTEHMYAKGISGTSCYWLAAIWINDKQGEFYQIGMITARDIF